MEILRDYNLNISIFLYLFLPLQYFNIFIFQYFNITPGCQAKP